MSSITSPSRTSKDPIGQENLATLDGRNGTRDSIVVGNKDDKGKAVEQKMEKLEGKLNIKDLESLQDAFMADGDGYDNRLSLTRDQFCEALALILNKGSKVDYGDLFDKIDVVKEGSVDWDKFASHMLLEFYEKDDRVKSTQVPQWKDLKTLPSPHKEVIQKISYLKNTNRYIAISKEGCVSMWGPNMKLQRSLKTGTDSCRARDLWVTNFMPLTNINKIALSFTSKEIAIYDLSTKLEFNCQYKVQGFDSTPLCLDYWSNPANVNEAILTWGDTGGNVCALHFTSANIALFERPPAPAGEKQEPCQNIQIKDVVKKKYKNARFTKHQGHTEWVRQVQYSAHLECFISCATTWNNSVVIGWLEKGSGASNMKTTLFQISQGVNAFDYHESLNQIATAGVNHHVCLWNPYVVSKPNGVLRGHMASVIQVRFIKQRGQLISFSKDKVLRIWDVQLQVCIQRLAGMFPKGPEVMSILHFDERVNRMFITFNYQLTVMEMRAEQKGRITTYDKPAVAAFYNNTYNQVVTASQIGTITMWMIDTGQKVKQWTKAHGDSELTNLAQDLMETRIYSSSTDGTIKIWDFNGHCYHTLHCSPDGQPADVGCILSLKRSIIVVGWAKYITVFRNQSFKDFHVEPADWKGGQEHSDDILAVAFTGPNTLATGSYDGEIVVWNNNSEQASKHITTKSRRQLTKGRTTFMTRENTTASEHTTGVERRPSASHSTSMRSIKSRAHSRASTLSEDQNEAGFAITRMFFLESRKKNSASGAANLLSCGGNGFVRFWNTSNAKLVGEFCAHQQVNIIIMAVDKAGHLLVTGDVDGLIKAWDITEHCLYDKDEVDNSSPPMKCQYVAHSDMIVSLEICERNERVLIISASLDGSVQLYDIMGNHFGVFGQEEHWKIEPYVPPDENETEHDAEDDQEDNLSLHTDFDSEWEPETEATERPETYRINTWDNTVLGKDYQELRVQKRERKQPDVIKDLPYLTWEKTGQPPAGPYAALDTKELRDVSALNKPDFMLHPHKYFSERSSANATGRLPALAESLKTAFDEKSLFPKYILDFEAKMKQYHAKSLNENQKKAGSMLKNVLAGGSGVGFAPLPSSTTPSGRSAASPKRNAPSKPAKLKPLSVRSGMSVTSMKESTVTE